jgi:hypothetical protein
VAKFLRQFSWMYQVIRTSRREVIECNQVGRVTRGAIEKWLETLGLSLGMLLPRTLIEAVKVTPEQL